MTIRFLFGRRESLYGKSEGYKKSVREYLESYGFSQTVDSSVEGSFEDMIFYNPNIAPGKRFLIEAKAEVVSLKSKKLARELVKYFRLWQAKDRDVKFLLFIQGVKRPKEWESIFSDINTFKFVQKWCEWYNKRCLKEGEISFDEQDVKEMSDFFADSEVIVGTHLDLQHAVLEKETSSAYSISRIAKSLYDLVDRRRIPVLKKSILVTNILSINVPKNYFICKSSARTKEEIYAGLKGKVIPPFLFTKDKEIMAFSEFDETNPLCKYTIGTVKTFNTRDFQIENSSFCSQLINIHFRRIIWNKGVYRDPKANIYYFPMIDKSSEVREISSYTGQKRWVVKKLVYTEDTEYHRKGDVNFYFHRGVELRTPTYWGNSFVEMIPRRYYTLDGIHWTDGEIRAKIDKKFRKSSYDRSKSRLSLMKFWKYILFESKDFVIPPEKWFTKLKFGDFVKDSVKWIPRVIGRNQYRLWDFKGDALNG